MLDLYWLFIPGMSVMRLFVLWIIFLLQISFFFESKPKIYAWRRRSLFSKFLAQLSLTEQLIVQSAVTGLNSNIFFLRQTIQYRNRAMGYSLIDKGRKTIKTVFPPRYDINARHLRLWHKLGEKVTSARIILNKNFFLRKLLKFYLEITALSNKWKVFLNPSTIFLACLWD